MQSTAVQLDMVASLVKWKPSGVLVGSEHSRGAHPCKVTVVGSSAHALVETVPTYPLLVSQEIPDNDGFEQSVEVQSSIVSVPSKTYLKK